MRPLASHGRRAAHRRTRAGRAHPGHVCAPPRRARAWWAASSARWSTSRPTSSTCPCPAPGVVARTIEGLTVRASVELPPQRLVATAVVSGWCPQRWSDPLRHRLRGDGPDDARGVVLHGGGTPAGRPGAPLAPGSLTVHRTRIGPGDRGRCSLLLLPSGLLRVFFFLLSFFLDFFLSSFLDFFLAMSPPQLGCQLR